MRNGQMYEFEIRRPDGRQCRTARKATTPEQATERVVAVYGPGTEILAGPTALAFTDAQLDTARADILRAADIPCC